MTEYSDFYSLSDSGSVGLRASSIDGRKVKLYAKTTRKVRLEVQNDYRNKRNLAPDRVHSFTALSDVIRMLEVSGQDSAIFAETFWGHLHERVQYPEVLAGDIIYFIKSFFTTLDNSELAGELFEQIAIEGGVPSAQLSPTIRQSLDELVNLGLVEKYGRPLRRYMIHRRFSVPLRRLLQNETE